MELQDFIGAKNVVVQIAMEKQVIEFSSEVVEKWMEGVMIKPYIYQNRPLELNITAESGIICTLCGDDPETGKRVAFRNVGLFTENYKGQIMYYVQAYGYNKVASISERRDKDRMELRIQGKVTDDDFNTVHEAFIHDISDKGISFYVPASFKTFSRILKLEFHDAIDDRAFDFSIECKVVRTVAKVGMVFYGCEVEYPDHDYQIYCMLKHMKA